MDRSRKTVEALGLEGLRRILHDAFDTPALIHVANACRVSYPGKRAQSVPPATLINDIAKKVTEEAASALALIKALDKACATEIHEVASMTEENLHHAGSEAPPPGRFAGRLLFALASDGRPAAVEAASRMKERLASTENPPADGAGSDSAGAAAQHEVARLRERVNRMEERRATVERQATDALKEAEQTASDLLQARKHAHALESKVGKLTEENASLLERNALLAGRVEQLERDKKEMEGPTRAASELKATLRENLKALHEMRETLGSRLASPADPARPYLEALAATLRSVQGEIAELRRERENDRRRDREAISELAREQHSMRGELAAVRSAAAPERPARRKGEPERVGLFVDVQNMYYAARQLNARLDFGALIESVQRERRLIRAIAYVVQNRDIDQSGFLAMLQQRNYEVRRKDLKVRADGSSKGDWDMDMALDMLDLADSLDVMVLASGDGDFVPLVNRIKTRGPRVEIYSFPGSTAKELIEACDRHIPIDEGLLIHMTSAT